MTITPERLDLIVPKGARFYQEFQQVDDIMAPISLDNKTIKCFIKESLRSTANLFELTEENLGTVIIDPDKGIFGIALTSDQTDISSAFGLYDILLIDLDHPTLDSERIVEGKITFSPGVTKQ